MSNTQRPSSPARHTVVEEGTEFQGTLKSSCPIDVRGRIEGDLATPALTVSASGAVHGKAKVGAVRSEGELSGEFDADIVELAGTVRDNTVIRARSLEVKLAASRGKLQVIFGECELSVGDEPTEHDRVEPPAVEAVAPVHTEVDLPAPVAPMEALGDAAPAAADPNAMTAEEEEGDEDPAEAMSADPAAQGSPGKRRKKRKNGQPEEAVTTGWSNPPSQPPPAS